jgi:hypothetical protein
MIAAKYGYRPVLASGSGDLAGGNSPAAILVPIARRMRELLVMGCDYAAADDLELI